MTPGNPGSAVNRDLPSHEFGAMGSISLGAIAGPFSRSAAGKPSTYMVRSPPVPVIATCFQTSSGRNVLEPSTDSFVVLPPYESTWIPSLVVLPGGNPLVVRYMKRLAGSGWPLPMS